MANGLFKGNATYFGRKSGTLEDVVEKINKANPKPEVFDIKKEANDYQMLVKKELQKAGKSLGDMSDQEKKDFFNGLDKKYKAKDEQMDDKAKKANQSQMSKDGEEESKAKKSVRETVQDLLLKSWKQAAQMAEAKHEGYSEKVIKAAKMYMKDGNCTYEMAAEKYGCSAEAVKKYVEMYKKEEKVTCPKCEGKGCEHCDGKGYHMKEMTDAQKKLPPALQKAIKKKEGK